MTFFYSLLAIKWVFLGAVFGRVDGGGIAKVPEWIERLLVMSAFVIACAPFAGVWSLLAFAGAVGIATGHGQYFLNLTVKAVNSEKVDFILNWIFGRDPRTNEALKEWRDEEWTNAPNFIKALAHLSIQDYGMNRLYWRNVAGMFLTGQLVGLPAFALSMVFGQTWGTLFLLTGLVKSIAYMVGFRFFKNTESAEYINGAGRHALCLLVILLTMV